MKTYSHMDAQLMAQMNKQSVMQCIADRGPISRSAIAGKVGLSVPTVMDITEELLNRGMISAQLKEGKVRGKRPELLSICGTNHRFVGVDIGRTMTRIVIAGLDQNVIARKKYSTMGIESPESYIDELCAQIKEQVNTHLGDFSTVVGVCVAMPGLIEFDTGRVIFSPNFGWENIPLQEWMNEKLQVQVIVENANRVQGIWELCRDRENATKTVLCVGLGYGIGGSMYYNGKIHYGASGTSGEIGHIRVTLDPSAKCTCGNTGCLEAVASGAALERQGKELARSGKGEALLALCGGDLEKIEAKTVFEAAENGDALSQELIAKAADRISEVLANSINLLDPERIYLCGGMIRNRYDFIGLIRNGTIKRQMYKAGRSMSILPGDPDEWNVAQGATRIIPYYKWDKMRTELMIRS